MSYLMPRRVSSISGAPLFLALAVSVSAQEVAGSDTYTIACFPHTGDLRTNTHTCRDAVISNGDAFHLTAGLATIVDARGLTFERIEWRFTEGVRLRLDSSELIAESAIFAFDADGEIAAFELTGSPAEFSDFIEERQAAVRATADGISYDSATDALSLDGQVRFSGIDGDGIDACRITYWLGEKRFVVGTTECNSLITLTRPASDDTRETSTAGP